VGVSRGFRAGIAAGAMRARGFDQPVIEQVCFKNWLGAPGRNGFFMVPPKRNRPRQCLGRAA
jgi:hypothetical protein